MAEIVVGNVVTIARIVLQIKEVADKVQRNKKDCSEIAKFVARNSALLKRLEEGTKITQDEVLCKTMEAVTENLNETLRLITECQKKNLISRFFRAGNMATDLSRVRTNLMENMMQASLATNIHGTILLETVAAAAPRHQPQVPFHRVPSTSSPPERHLVTRQTSSEVSSEAQVGHSSHGGHSTAGGSRSQLSDWNEVNEQEEETMTSIGNESPTSLSSGFRQFNLSELKAATDDFSDAMMLARGGFSYVYKGVLHDGSLVAIKKLDDIIDSNDFLRKEFRILGMLQHKNVVKLVGYCIDVKLLLQFNGQYVLAEEWQQCLVLGYVPNGDLQMIIDNGYTRIDWSSCFRIIQGIVQCVHYLHQQRVVHMDVKPQNIRFDLEMNPVIIDFGLSVLLDPNEDEVTLDYNAGTIGYVPPEQFDKGTASTKSDVYGFGVTLRKTISSLCTGSQGNWQTMLRDSGGVAGSIYRMQVDESQLMEIKRCEVVGLLCTEYDLRDRPDMADVLMMLKGEKELPTPKNPWP